MNEPLHMNLCIDIGNSLAKTAVFSGSKIVNLRQSPEIGAREIDSLISEFPEINNIILCSVRTHDQDLITLLQKRIARVLVFDEDTAIPLTNLYKSANTLGKDRLAAITGANNIFPDRNVLVVDAGTAITFDLVDEFNRFVGGNISPGMTLRFRALHEFTGRLPLVSPVENAGLLADNTTDAIASGVQNGIIFEMETYISRLKEKYSDLEIIFTGGDAKYFDKKLKYTIFVDPNLVFTGLNRILTYNVNKK
ncbi:MAG: type III pantothenate kinase [Bacteroidales bacterium]